VARVLSTAVVLALLAATAIAFAITEGAKLTKSPIAGTEVTPIFSPKSVVEEKTVAHVEFRLRTRERLTVWIQNAQSDRVETLLPPRSARAGTKFDLLWDGFSPGGVINPDGNYQPVVKLERSHRTIVLPSTIALDTKPPVVTAKVVSRHPIVSPDGDGHADTVRITYTMNEPAHAVLLVRGRRVLFTLDQKQHGEIVWTGLVRNSQHELVRARPGRYLLSVAAQDRAGNLSKAVPVAIAQVRYVVLARKRVVVRPGGRFALRVSTDAPTVHWQLHGRSGVQRAGTLHLRAPKSPGVYRLYVTAGDHSAVTTVVVA
jgi:hypothetical protein